LKNQTNLNIKEYLTEIQKEIFEIISEHKNILISSNPASGKTTLFAQLCINSIANPINNRIIFCAPYLIIQEQFKQRLLDSKVSVDFELNGLSKRKNLNKEDRIATSTFKSFPKISESLNPEDIVIIDEAHSLLVIFTDKKANKHDHFGNFYKSLYDTKAKIVLMTGTPVESFHYWFDHLHEIKVFKESIKAKVNIQYSKSNENDIVIQFTKECIKNHGENSLNIIYVKSKNKCEKIAEIIDQLGHKGLVLTSETKSSKEYKELVESSIISHDYQFLITTNVISTGTNILNKNIGKALMLNEHDPIEIKQFSKRFRNKLDIEIDVINKPQKNVDDFQKIRKILIAKRTLNREYLRKVKQNLYTETELNNSAEFEFNQFGGEASHLNPKSIHIAYLKRNLLQEIYYHKEITKTYNDRKEIVKALNEFDDIISIEIQEYESGKMDVTFDEKAYQENKKEYFNKVIKAFIEQPEVYLCAFSKYIQVYHKYSELIHIKYILDKFEITEMTIAEANKLSIHTDMLDKLISPLVSYYDLFFINQPKLTLTRCLTFIKNVPPNKQSKYIISLWFNDKFHNYLKIPNNYDLQNENLEYKNPWESKNKDLIYFLLNQTFLFIMGNEEIYYNHFKDSFISSSHNKNFYPDEFFPWSSQLTFKDGCIIEMDRNFGFGLLTSIFAIKSKQVQKHHPKVLEKGRVNTILPSDLDSIESFNCLSKEELNKYLSGLIPIKTAPPTMFYEGFNLNETERVIIDRNYLTIIANHSS
tara:strand:+ start:42137 stop:44413 length:2277 start_codon:yes stop_codon:yes gene_type:complete